jgi:hypothetical protein
MPARSGPRPTRRAHRALHNMAHASRAAWLTGILHTTPCVPQESRLEIGYRKAPRKRGFPISASISRRIRARSDDERRPTDRDRGQ